MEGHCSSAKSQDDGGQDGWNENPLRTGEKPQLRRWLRTPQMGNWTVENESAGDPSPSPKAHCQWRQGRPPLETTSQNLPPAGTDGPTGQGQSSYWESPQRLPDPALGRRSLEKVQRLSLFRDREQQRSNQVGPGGVTRDSEVTRLDLVGWPEYPKHVIKQRKQTIREEKSKGLTQSNNDEEIEHLECDIWP